jgi:hypothetical protein
MSNDCLSFRALVEPTHRVIESKCHCQAALSNFGHRFPGGVFLPRSASLSDAHVRWRTVLHRSFRCFTEREV